MIWTLFRFNVLPNASKNVRMSSLFFEFEHPARLSDKKQVIIRVKKFFHFGTPLNVLILYAQLKGEWSKWTK